MSKPPRIYTRLTRRTASISSYQSLWLAADHLLIVTSTGYTETYQRLRLRDIKGFFVIDSKRRIYWSLPWAAVAIPSGAVMAYAFFNHGIPVFSTILFGLSLAALVWNYLLGPGCRAFVVTGVQTASLPSLVRRGKTRKVLNRIEPLIVAAQADLVPPLAATADPVPAVGPPLS